MLNELKKESNIAYTENGAVSNASSFNECLDFFALCGALRNAEPDRIESLFLKAYVSSPDYAMKTLFYARDIRMGLGERRIFRICLKFMAHKYPQSIRKNIPYIAEYGRFDDLLELFDTPCENDVLSYIKGVLEEDCALMKKNMGVSLLAKWLPSVNASNALRKHQAKRIAKYLKISEKKYRQMLSALRAYIDILETHLCNMDYTFDYEKQPSNAMFKYRRAFLRNDGERYVAYLERVKEDKAKMHTGTLYPYEIIRQAFNEELTEEGKNALDVTWNALPDYCDNRNAIAVVDGSGSMYYDRGIAVRPIDIALSLGIYFAEHNKGFFQNHFITFSRRPKLVKIKGNDIFSKVHYCESYDDISNTNIMRVYGLILQTAVKNKLPQSELPETIYIISDMEFDEGSRQDMSLHEEVKMLYKRYGYVLPNVVYWNVNSHQNQFPVTEDEYGTVLVSGASPNLFKMVISQETNPMSYMLTILNDKRYAAIKA